MSQEMVGLIEEAATEVTRQHNLSAAVEKDPRGRLGLVLRNAQGEVILRMNGYHSDELERLLLRVRTRMFEAHVERAVERAG
jgi:hypothetical protein